MTLGRLPVFAPRQSTPIPLPAGGGDMVQQSLNRSERVVVDDLGDLLEVLPPMIRVSLERHTLAPDLLEVSP